MEEIRGLEKRKRDLTWSMLLHTPRSFLSPGAVRDSLELDRVTTRINVLAGRA